MTEELAPELITLHEALAIAGPEVVWGWTGEEFDPHIWRPAAANDQARAGQRWRATVKFVEGERASGNLDFFVRTYNGVTVVPAEWFKGGDPGRFYLTGRLTRLSLEEAVAELLAGHKNDEPVLYLSLVTLKERIAHRLRPDFREFWSLIEVLAWIICRRYDAVREYQIENQNYDVLSEDLREAHEDGTQIRDDAVSDLLRNLQDGKLVCLACPCHGDSRRTAVPAIEWQDYVLTTTRVGDARLDAIARRWETTTPVYLSPLLSRVDVLTRWPEDRGAETVSTVITTNALPTARRKKNTIEEAIERAIREEWPTLEIPDPRPAQVLLKIKKHRGQIWPSSDKAAKTAIARVLAKLDR